MRSTLFLLLSTLAAAAAVVVGAAPEPAAGAAPRVGLKLLANKASSHGAKTKPLLARASAEKKPTPASLALQRLQTLAVNALRDRGYTDVVEVTAGDDQLLGRWGKLGPLSSMAGGGAGKAEGSSIVTLDLPKTPLAELANVVDLYQSIFGVTPDFSNVNDTTSFYKRVQDIILSSAPAISFDCQPSFRIWPKEINFAFPDQHSAVHFFVLPSFGPNDLVMIEGAFPDARYFSFQTFDASLRPLSFLRDAQIRPLGVSNPFGSVPPPWESGNGGQQQQRGGVRDDRALYRLYLTKDGNRGFPNELAAANHNFALRGQVLVLLRLYGIDPRADTSRPELEPWGYAPPVRVSARVLGTISPTATDLIWETYPECSANNTLVVRDALTAVTNLVKMVDTRQGACQSENVADNFVLYRPEEQRLTSRTPFANSQDAGFLLACANHRQSYRKSNDLIAVVHTHLPRTPVGLSETPFVGDPMSYDVRYASFSVTDLNPPGPVLRTVSDDEFRAFYHRRYGPMQWEALYDRNVSLVVARNSGVLERCGVDVSSSFVVELEDQMPMSDWFGIVYREVLPQGALLREEETEDAMASPTQAKAAAASTPRLARQQQPRQRPWTRAPYTESIYDAQRRVCADEQIGGECDPNPYRVATIMKRHFPRVHYYFCSQLGTLSPAPQGADPFAGKGYPRLPDEADGSGPWPAVPTYMEFCNASGPNEGLVRVFSPAHWLHIHYRDPRAPATAALSVKVVQPGTVGTLAFPVNATAETVAVGVSVKATNASQAPFMAEVELCGSVFSADPHWRCYNEPPVDWEAWLLPTFEEDGRWRPATWAPRSLEAASSTVATGRAREHFSRGARFVLPAPVLDAEAEEAWRVWAATKDAANEAWRAWRAAKEDQTNARISSERMENGTLVSVSMRGGAGGGNNKSSASVDWKGHTPPNTTDSARLEWHKPRPVAAMHGYFCRLAFPNPARAYSPETQGRPAKAGAAV